MAQGAERTLKEKQRDINAVRFVYQDHVPHTDRQGRQLNAYDPQKSFFQIGAWGVPMPGKIMGEEVDWAELKSAGFNTVWPYHQPLDVTLKAGEAAGMQIVHMTHPDDRANVEKVAQVLGAVKDNPYLLGNVWADEPIGNLTPGFDMEKFFQEFVSYKEAANKAAPGLPVFVNDAPWIMAPATSWWVKWNTTGNLSCHDNYPAIIRSHGMRSVSAEPNGISQTVSLATAANKEDRPVWFIVGSFEQITNMDYPCRFCTAMQLRAQVYSAVINGATGIVYFIWDTWIARDAGIIGISPNPKVLRTDNPGAPGTPKATPATPMQMIQSKELWMAAEQINKELKDLTPSIFSPTVKDVNYKVEITGESVTEIPINCMLKPHPDGGYVLLTVNNDDSVLNVKYTFPDKLVEAAKMYENQPPQQLSEDGKSFSVRYEPFDTHVIRIK